MAETTGGVTAAGSSRPRSRHGVRTRAAVALSVLAFIAAAVRIVLPETAAPTAGLIPPWAAVVVTAAGVIVATAFLSSWSRLVPRRLMLMFAWLTCAGLLAVSAVRFAFDVLGSVMWVIGTLTGESGPVSLPMDWAGTAARVLALAAALALAKESLSYQRHSRGACGGCGRSDGDGTAVDGMARQVANSWARTLRYAAYPAAALAFGYGALKAQWGLGGTVGLADPRAFGDDVHLWTPGLGDTAVLAAIGIVLAFALAHPWGQRVPRWMPLSGAMVGCAMLIPVGLMGGYGTFSQVLGGQLPGSGMLAPWVFLSIYPWFLTWGLTLGAAAWSYYHRTRPRCARCGRQPSEPALPA